jgi:hypothetical protein
MHYPPKVKKALYIHVHVCVYQIFSAKHAMVILYKDKKLPFSLVVSIFKEFYKLDGEYEK